MDSPEKMSATASKPEKIEERNMEKSDIAKKLRPLEGIESKIEYLNNILRKEKLLNPETRVSVYEILAEGYGKLREEKKWSGYLINSAECFEKAGLEDKAISKWREIVKIYMQVDVPNDDVVLHAANSLRRFGHDKEAREIERELGRKFEERGLSEKSLHVLELAHKAYEVTGQSNEAKRVEKELQKLKKEKKEKPKG